MDLYKGAATIDFDFAMTVHPVTKDLVLKRDGAAIIQAVRFLVMTSFGEILNEPDIGGGMGQVLFEQVDSLTAFNVRRRVEETIKNHEPRADLKSVDVNRSAEGHGIIVSVVFFYNNNPTPYEMSFTIRRTR